MFRFDLILLKYKCPISTVNPTKELSLDLNANISNTSVFGCVYTAVCISQEEIEAMVAAHPQCWPVAAHPDTRPGAAMYFFEGRELS